MKRFFQCRTISPAREQRVWGLYAGFHPVSNPKVKKCEFFFISALYPKNHHRKPPNCWVFIPLKHKSDISVLAEAQNKALNSYKNNHYALFHGHISPIQTRKCELTRLIQIKENILRQDSSIQYDKRCNPANFSNQPEDKSTIFLPANPAFQVIWCSLCIVKIV